MTIKQNQLKEIIKQVVRESLDETIPVNKSLPLRPIGKTKASGTSDYVGLRGQNYGPKGYGPKKSAPAPEKPLGQFVKDQEAWAAQQNGLKTRKVNEAGLASETNVGGEKRNRKVLHWLKQLSRIIGDSAKINALSPEAAKKEILQIQSMLTTIISDLSWKSDGVNEAAYKVVAPRSATDAKEDKARRIQTEPKVNETAYKVQGPSGKVFKDSPKGDTAYKDDPKNA